MICHTDAASGNRTTRDTDDEDADGDEDRGSSQRRVDASTKLKTRVGASLSRTDKACPAVRSGHRFLRSGQTSIVVVAVHRTIADRRVRPDVQQRTAERAKPPAPRNLRLSSAYPCCRGQLVRLPGVG